jgi:hypothetical protein
MTDDSNTGNSRGSTKRRILDENYAVRPCAQPALLVRASSRRIMSLRFRPAHISVINRRASSRLFPVLLSNAPGSPAGIPFPPSRRPLAPLPEQCSLARVRFAAPAGPPLLAPRRSGLSITRRAAPAGTENIGF